MKKFKLFAILGLCFGMLFLTACGDGEKSNTESKKKEETKKTTPVLTCSMDQDDTKLTMKVKYDKEEVNPKEVDMTISMEIPDDITDDMIPVLLDTLEQTFCSDSNLKCAAKQNGGYVEINISGGFEELADLMDSLGSDGDISDAKPLDEVKANAEADGAVCTKSYE